MDLPKLETVTDQHHWLCCLQAAANIASGEQSAQWVLSMADLFYAQFRYRIQGPVEALRNPIE